MTRLRKKERSRLGQTKSLLFDPSIPQYSSRTGAYSILATHHNRPALQLAAGAAARYRSLAPIFHALGIRLGRINPAHQSTAGVRANNLSIKSKSYGWHISNYLCDRILLTYGGGMILFTDRGLEWMYRKGIWNRKDKLFDEREKRKFDRVSGSAIFFTGLIMTIGTIIAIVS